MSYLVKTLSGRTLEIEATSFQLRDSIYIFLNNGLEIASVPGMGVLAVVQTEAAKNDGWDEKITQNLFESDEFFQSAMSVVDFWHDMDDEEETTEEKKETIQ